jgi:hypothetical protein
MKRVFVFLVLAYLLVVSPVLARDVVVGLVTPAKPQRAFPGTSAGFVSEVLTDVAAEMAWNAARDYGPSAVRVLKKHGPAVFGLTRAYAERAVALGEQYALQAWAAGKRYVPQILPDDKNPGARSLAGNKSGEKNGPSKASSGTISPSRTVALAKMAPEMKVRKPAKEKGTAAHLSR